MITYNLKNKYGGFTLVEIIVVIAIIAVLATGLMVGINPKAQQDKAKDATRLSDISEIRKGLNLYYSDTNCYPVANSAFETALAGASQWKEGETVYMQKVPKDPAGSAYIYVAEESTCPQWGTVFAKLSKPQVADPITHATAFCPLANTENDGCFPDGFDSSWACASSGNTKCATAVTGIVTSPGPCTPTAWYQDGDRDGYGNPSVTQSSCTTPIGYVANKDDCDDQSSTIKLGSTRLRYGSISVSCGTACGSETQTCQSGGTWSGTFTATSCTVSASTRTMYAASSACATTCVSETQSCQANGTWSGTYASASCSVTSLTTYYRDADGDGYGSSSVTQSSCTMPAGYVANSSDCYDSSANVRPGQTAYFSVSRGDGSYDYNCSGTNERGNDVRTANYIYGEGYLTLGCSASRCDTCQPVSWNQRVKITQATQAACGASGQACAPAGTSYTYSVFRGGTCQSWNVVSACATADHPVSPSGSFSTVAQTCR